MKILCGGLLVCLITLSVQGEGFKMFTRKQWGARPPRAVEKLQLPVPLVVMHHTHTRGCNSTEDCSRLVRAIQDFHMDAHGWFDIGYNFLVDNNGEVFEGRGWAVHGAHTLGYNSLSEGIAILGNFDNHPPEGTAVDTAKSLIEFGVKKGFIKDSYHLVGHRQANHRTTCPGDYLYALLQGWHHYTPTIPAVPINTSATRGFQEM